MLLSPRRRCARARAGGRRRLTRRRAARCRRQKLRRETLLVLAPGPVSRSKIVRVAVVHARYISVFGLFCSTTFVLAMRAIGLVVSSMCCAGLTLSDISFQSGALTSCQYLRDKARLRHRTTLPSRTRRAVAEEKANCKEIEIWRMQSCNSKLVMINAPDAVWCARPRGRGRPDSVLVIDREQKCFHCSAAEQLKHFSSRSIDCAAHYRHTAAAAMPQLHYSYFGNYSHTTDSLQHGACTTARHPTTAQQESAVVMHSRCARRSEAATRSSTCTRRCALRPTSRS